MLSSPRRSPPDLIRGRDHPLPIGCDGLRVITVGWVIPSTAQAHVVVDEWVRAGVTDAVACPGSRNAPLLVALYAADRDGRLRLHVRIDERGAGFLAVGLGSVSGRIVPVVVTSGTAVANLHPAVLEASRSGVGLLVVSADRPVELVGSGANQTIDQVGMYGEAVRASVVMPLAEDRPGAARSWRAVVARALDRAAGTSGGDPGPVQLNVPLREPLLDPQGAADPRTSSDPALEGRPDGAPWTGMVAAPPASTLAPLALRAGARTLVVAGHGGEVVPAGTRLPDGVPVLAEPTSPLWSDPAGGRALPAGTWALARGAGRDARGPAPRAGRRPRPPDAAPRGVAPARRPVRHRRGGPLGGPDRRAPPAGLDRRRRVGDGGRRAPAPGRLEARRGLRARLGRGRRPGPRGARLRRRRGQRAGPGRGHRRGAPIRGVPGGGRVRADPGRGARGDPARRRHRAVGARRVRYRRGGLAGCGRRARAPRADLRAARRPDVPARHERPARRAGGAARGARRRGRQRRRRRHLRHPRAGRPPLRRRVRARLRGTRTARTSPRSAPRTACRTATRSRPSSGVRPGRSPRPGDPGRGWSRWRSTGRNGAATGEQTVAAVRAALADD